MSGILFYSEQGILALELLTVARKLSAEFEQNIQALTINDDEQAKRLEQLGANVYQITAPDLMLADTSAMATVLQKTAEDLNISLVLLASNRRGKELAGRLAQKLSAGCLTDVNDFHCQGQHIEWTRNNFGGATVAIQEITSEIKVVAITPRSFAGASDEGRQGKRQPLDIQVPPATLTVLETKAKKPDTADIQNADILVVIGQGVEKEDLAGARNVAELLGGEIACSKPVATDKKWLPEERVVGLSGKTCKPQLAIIFGVSGQVQFNVGIRDAQTIVAVNNDENAYILKMADYLMVADAKQVIADLVQNLNE